MANLLTSFQKLLPLKFKQVDSTLWDIIIIIVIIMQRLTRHMSVIR